MKANLLLYDYPLEKVDEPGGACLRYSNPDEKTFNLIIDLLEGFENIIIYTYSAYSCDVNMWKLIKQLLINQKSVKLKQRS